MFPAAEVESNISLPITASRFIELRTSFNPTTNVNVSIDFIRLPNGNSSVLLLGNNDIVSYDVDTGNTVITGLANGTSYYVAYANSTGFKLSTTANGSSIVNLQSPLPNEVGHGITNIL